MISLHRVSRLKKKEYGGRCHFRHTEAGGQPSSKKSKKSGGQGSAALVKENIQMGCVFQDNPHKKSIVLEVGKLGSNRTVKFSKTSMRHASTFGKERIHCQGVIAKMCT